MKQVVVTGANGFLGRKLVQQLLNQGMKVIAIDKCFDDNEIMGRPLLSRYEIDLRKLNEQFGEDLIEKKCDLFYHFAWLGVNGKEKTDPQVQLDNIRIMIKCADWAKKMGCEKFLCAGTVAERAVDSLSYLDKVPAGMMYGSAKHCARIFVETYCKTIGLKMIWMQFANIYGPGNKTGNLLSYLANEVLHGNEAVFGMANQPYDFIYIDDLIYAVYKLGIKETHKSFYYVGSGKPRILKEYLIEVGEMLGKSELICIGKRPDDGIKYSYDMFDISALLLDIGDYLRTDFSEGIKQTFNI